MGGNSIIKMDALRACLEQAGLQEVKTYIQSGNVIFRSAISEPRELAKCIEQCIADNFGISAEVAICTGDQWRHIVENAPSWWGEDPTWKHNLFILLDPADMEKVIEALGTLKPEIEKVSPGEGIIYQSLLFAKFGQTSSSKLVGKPAYRRITIRNASTTRKLLQFL